MAEHFNRNAIDERSVTIVFSGNELIELHDAVDAVIVSFIENCERDNFSLSHLLSAQSVIKNALDQNFGVSEV